MGDQTSHVAWIGVVPNPAGTRMRWEPITADNVVAKLTVASEHALSDFKSNYAIADPTTGFEIAKDLCTFANHLGGTILVGVHEGTGARKGMIGTFAALTAPTPGDLVKAIDRAVRLYCAPQPSVRGEELASEV